MLEPTTLMRVGLSLMWIHVSLARLGINSHLGDCFRLQLPLVFTHMSTKIFIFITGDLFDCNTTVVALKLDSRESKITKLKPLIDFTSTGRRRRFNPSIQKSSALAGHCRSAFRWLPICVVPFIIFYLCRDNQRQIIFFIGSSWCSY